MIDFSRIPTRQDQINLRLEQWAKWCMDHGSGSGTSPMFRLYRSKSRQWEMPTITVHASPRDNLEIERAVVNLPENHRTAIRWAYCFPWVPVSAVRIELAVTREGLAELIMQGRDMLIARLRLKLSDEL